MTDMTCTTDTFDERGHPAWRVAGPLGIVTYRSLNNRITIEPIGAEASLLTSRHADEVKLAATTGTDEDVLRLLAGWYTRLPDLGQPTTLDPADPWAFPPDPSEGELLYAWQESIESGRPVSAAERHAFDQAQHRFDRRSETAERGPETGNPEIDRWRELRGADLTVQMMAATWYVQTDDLIGGWCVTVVDLPPSAGAPEVASFLDQGAARHIADLHNAHISNEARRASDRTRIAEILAARPDVQPGDLIDVPAGADRTVTTRHRVCVESVSNYGAGGYKIRADGQPQVSRSTITATKAGYVSGYVEWSTILVSTITRGGETIYAPGGQP